jgi:hypothetical protein
MYLYTQMILLQNTSLNLLYMYMYNKFVLIQKHISCITFYQKHILVYITNYIIQYQVKILLDHVY